MGAKRGRKVAMNWVIVTAGGSGKRMKHKINKGFLPILGKPVAFYTLKTLEEIGLIDKIIVTVCLIDKPEWQKLITKFGFKKVVKLIPAEETRQASTWKALKWLKEKVTGKDLVAVHNVVNPLATPGEIEAVFKAARKFGAALLATPARDTVKIASDDKIIKETPLRQFVWCAQTPQVAHFRLIFKAFQRARKEKFTGTDDSQLLEKIGVKVKIVPCSIENFKITYPLDLLLARKILQERSQ